MTTEQEIKEVETLLGKRIPWGALQFAVVLDGTYKRKEANSLTSTDKILLEILEDGRKLGFL